MKGNGMVLAGVRTHQFPIAESVLKPLTFFSEWWNIFETFLNQPGLCV